MLTLSEANDLVKPVLKSEIFKTSIALQEKTKEIQKMFEGFEYKGPFKLNQFEILDEAKEKAFREMRAIYEEEIRPKGGENANQGADIKIEAGGTE